MIDITQPAISSPANSADTTSPQPATNDDVANLQDIMHTPFNLTCNLPGRFGAWITPAGGESLYVTVEAPDLATAQARVHAACRLQYRSFTFSVRPL